MTHNISLIFLLVTVFTVVAFCRQFYEDDYPDHHERPKRYNHNENECMDEFGAIKSFDNDDVREEKCFTACFMKAQEILDNEGHLNKEKMLEYFLQVAGEHDHDDCKDAILHCIDTVQVESDQCETAHNFDVCVNEQDSICGKNHEDPQ